MIAVSSFRPHQDPEYRDNQVRAFDSWHKVFSKIIYFGKPEPVLSSNKTEFIDQGDWPSVRSMVEQCSKSDTEYACIINADIVVSPILWSVFIQMKKNRIKASTSRRVNFDISLGLHSGKITDFGMDVFIATPETWKMVLNFIPESFRIGHPLWDNWMCGFFNSKLKNHFADFTSYKCIFHPIHNGRMTPFEIKDTTAFANSCSLPARKL